ncbi:MAG: DUF1844 domain-containing protein [Bdellovibrio sp. CG10_big_fil_rev_8_21_14_0_10_47_8]|nr:MAG: DUF1844 domain-containing protein [Bdellovibrio sp. CG10_big_fil_rev_8_21_14_0_10_47_8]
MQKLEATFSVLTMSIASSAAMALGLAPDPQSGNVQKDKDMAKFNIDLLLMLKEKTKGNLSADEQRFMESVISDLQMKFVAEK